MEIIDDRKLKAKVVAFRLTNSEKRVLNEIASKNQSTKSEYLREKFREILLQEGTK